MQPSSTNGTPRHSLSDIPAMILAQSSSRQIPTVRFITTPPTSSSSSSSSPTPRFLTLHRRRRYSLFKCSCSGRSLPFAAETAKYHLELEAAIAAVESASELCVEVQTSLLSKPSGILQKTDQTPVTVADFSVQALISLELGRRFPWIPLVAEEDSASVQANNLVEPVVEAVVGKMSGDGEKPLTAVDVLEAIDRGGPEAFTFGAQPATYWLLDPIDGTRGFVKGNKALFVVGLALVVDGEIVLGVMGCPHWQEDTSNKSISEDKCISSESGLLMISHVGRGTWTRSLSSALNGTAKIPYSWTRCFVDGCSLVPEARFCIIGSEPWEALPPSASFTETCNADSVGDGRVLVLKPCCGSLCKYLLVASGRGSVYIQRQKDRVAKAWDHAAGIICVLEAGGMATDWEGNQVDLAADEVGRRNIYPQGGFLVSNGHLHNQLLELILSTSSTVPS